MPIIRTVRGDIPPHELGFTLLHEHLITTPPAESDPDLEMPSVDAAVEELKKFRALGGGGLVEMTTRDYGRHPNEMREASERSGVHVIATTGFIKGAFAEAIVEKLTVNQIVDEMIRDICEGFEGTNIRAGVIKAGSSKDKITPNEEKVLRAAARAHRETGAPISTHTEAGTMALEQVALFKSEGVKPERILIGHCDRKLEWDYHVQIAATGVHLGYDQFSKHKYYPDAERVAFIARMVQLGYRDQITISGDLARKSNWTSYGGAPGLAHIPQTVLPMLREAGLTDDDIEAIFVRTPARLLAFEG